MAQGGSGVVHSTACQRCWAPFARCWSREFTRSELCGRVKSDANFRAAFEATRDVQAGGLTTFDEQAVVKAFASGFRIVRDLAFVPVRQFEAAFGSTFPASTANVRLCHMPDAHGVMQKLLLVQHPSKPWVDVQVFTEYKLRKQTFHWSTSASSPAKLMELRKRTAGRCSRGCLAPSGNKARHLPCLR